MQKKKKLKIHVALDSNQYFPDRLFEKPMFALLKALIRYDLIQLHIPWFVYKECTSKYIDEISRELHHVVRSLESIEEMGAGTKLGKEFTDTAKRLKSTRDSVADSVEKVWLDFIKETKATLHPFSKEDSIDVFDSYFTGGKPFNALKARNDIPDAFIFKNALRIAEDKVLHFICHDKNLRTHLESQANVKTYKNFKDFFNSPELKPINTEYERLEKFQRLKSKLLKRDNEIMKYFMKELQSHAPFEASSKDFRSDDNVATINTLDSPTVKILTNEIIFVDDLFYVPVVISALASIEYFLYKSDYHMLYDDKKISVSNWNDHYFLAEEVIPIVFIYKVAINKATIEDEDDLQIDFSFKDFTDIYVGLDEETREMLF